MPTLTQVLTQHPNIQFGSKSGLYLSFNGKEWSVQNFNGCFGFIYRLFRWMGCYSSTHSKTIAAQLQKESNVPPALFKKFVTTASAPLPPNCEPKERGCTISSEEGVSQSMLIGQSAFCLLSKGALERAGCKTTVDVDQSRPDAVEPVIEQDGETTRIRVPGDWAAGLPLALDLAKRNGKRSVAIPLLGGSNGDLMLKQVKAVHEYLRLPANNRWFNLVVFFNPAEGPLSAIVQKVWMQALHGGMPWNYGLPATPASTPTQAAPSPASVSSSAAAAPKPLRAPRPTGASVSLLPDGIDQQTAVIAGNRLCVMARDSYNERAFYRQIAHKPPFAEILIRPDTLTRATSSSITGPLNYVSVSDSNPGSHEGWSGAIRSGLEYARQNSLEVVAVPLKTVGADYRDQLTVVADYLKEHPNGFDLIICTSADSKKELSSQLKAAFKSVTGPTTPAQPAAPAAAPSSPMKPIVLPSDSDAQKSTELNGTRFAFMAMQHYNGVGWDLFQQKQPFFEVNLVDVDQEPKVYPSTYTIRVLGVGDRRESLEGWSAAMEKALDYARREKAQAISIPLVRFGRDAAAERAQMAGRLEMVTQYLKKHPNAFGLVVCLGGLGSDKALDTEFLQLWDKQVVPAAKG